MKTVIDSVNEFKGGWPLLRYTTDNWYEDGCNLFHNEETICSEDEFIATAAECETNFGECKQSYSDYEFDYRLHLALKRNKPTKELDVMEGINKGDLIRIKGKIYKLRDHFATTSSRHQELIDSGFLEQEPQPTPIFTQEMVDNGVLPSVGMECLINFPDIDNAWYKYTIDFMGKHTFIASCEDVSERFGHVDDVYFKPLDTRTDKEKAIDEYIESQHHGLDSLSQSIKTIMKNAFEAGVSFQPLTVEVKECKL